MHAVQLERERETIKILPGLSLCVSRFQHVVPSVIEWKHLQSIWPRHPNNFRRCFQCGKVAQHSLDVWPVQENTAPHLSAHGKNGWKRSGASKTSFHSNIPTEAESSHTLLSKSTLGSVPCLTILTPLILLYVSMYFRLTNSSLRRPCGHWIISTRKRRSWEASRILKAVWPASQHTLSSCVWRLTMRRWETFHLYTCIH